MQTERHKYKTLRVVYEDDAYNLPLDTVYFIESKSNSHLNDYVSSHKQEIEQRLHQDIGGFFCYKFEIISFAMLQNPIWREAIGKLHPELPEDVKKQVYKEGMKVYNPANQTDFEINFLARIAPTQEDTYEFYTLDISQMDEKYIDKVLAKYLKELNYLNFLALTQKDSWRNYTIQSKSISLSEWLPVGLLANAVAAMAVPMGGIASVPLQELANLHIDPKLRELAHRIDLQIKEYQRDNGVNVLLENIYEDFLRSFSKLEINELSSLVIDNSYSICLKEYNKKIKMHTFPKAVYIFFLRHPDGIYLKDISDYGEELHRIYRTIMRYDWNEDVTRAKIDSLVDVSSGILNQYICRIAESFRNEVSSELARNYIISGKRNELRRIPLEKSKITLPESLLF